MAVEITPDELDVATRVADRVAGRHRGIVTRDDVLSTLTVWMLEHEDDVLRMREHGRGLYTALRRAAARYVTAERGAIFGYDPKDQFPYTPALLRELLSELVVAGYDEEHVPVLEVPAVAAGSQRAQVGGSGGSDPAFGGNRLVMLVDAHVALSALSPALNVRVREAVAAGWDEGYLADAWTRREERPVTTKAVRERIMYALRKVASVLSDLREDRQFTGARRAVSNAKARWAINAGAPEPQPERHPWGEGGLLS